MVLNAGKRLGPYEIVAPIGAGGMGEVYKAKDTRLDRIVAIKVLPEHLSQNAELKQRFEQEARAVSSLNHPHIRTSARSMTSVENRRVPPRLRLGPWRCLQPVPAPGGRKRERGATHDERKYPGTFLLVSRWSHHIFTKGDVQEILNLQPKGSRAKPYQVKQVRRVMLE